MSEQALTLLLLWWKFEITLQRLTLWLQSHTFSTSQVHSLNWLLLQLFWLSSSVHDRSSIEQVYILSVTQQVQQCRSAFWPEISQYVWLVFWAATWTSLDSRTTDINKLSLWLVCSQHCSFNPENAENLGCFSLPVKMQLFYSSKHFPSAIKS